MTTEARVKAFSRIRRKRATAIRTRVHSKDEVAEDDVRMWVLAHVGCLEANVEMRRLKDCTTTRMTDLCISPVGLAAVLLGGGTAGAANREAAAAVFNDVLRKMAADIPPLFNENTMGFQIADASTRAARALIEDDGDEV